MKMWINVIYETL